jgi:hypothetical protein
LVFSVLLSITKGDVDRARAVLPRLRQFSAIDAFAVAYFAYLCDQQEIRLKDQGNILSFIKLSFKSF